MGALGLQLPLAANTQAMPVYQLDPLVVVAPNVWGAESQVYGEAMRSAKPLDLAEILSAQLPSTALTRKGPLAGDLVLRGFTRDNIVITVDGNQTFCACPNRMDPPAFHVSSQQIEGVRVRTGPFSVDQGGSVGGTVAVRTTAPLDAAFARFYGYFGSFDYIAAGATGSYPLTAEMHAVGGLYYQRGGVFKDGDGVRFTELPGTNYQPQYFDSTAFEVFSAEAKAAHSVGTQGLLTVQYAVQEAQDVLYPGLRMDAPSDTMHRVAVNLRTPVDLQMADTLEATLALSHVDHDMRDSLRTSVNAMGGAFAARGYFMRTQATSMFVSGRLEMTKSLLTTAHLRYGADWKRRYWEADNIIGNQSNNMLPDTVQDTFGVWGVYEERTGPWAVEMGGRLDVGRSAAREDLSFLQSVRSGSPDEGYDWLPSAYALASRELLTGLDTYVGLGFASRIPDPQERYMQLDRPMANVDWVGDPQLDPVRNLEMQGGLRWQGGHADAQLTVFHAWVFDYIYLQQLNVGSGATSYTNMDVRLYGVSADVGWQGGDSLRLEAGLAWQEGVKETYSAEATSDVLGEVPPLRGRLAALFEFADFTAKAEGQLQSDFDRIDPAIGEVPIGGWAVLNLAGSYRFNEHFGVSVGVDNVFDRTYAVANSFIRDPFRSGIIVHEPGRFWFVRGGVEF